MNTKELYNVLVNLRLEAIHYRNTHVGIQHLNAAIENAEKVINKFVGPCNKKKMGEYNLLRCVFPKEHKGSCCFVVAEEK